MENVLLQLADAADYPAFCAGQDGEVLYANRAAEEQWPVWQGCTLPELLPEFFAGGEYHPYFRYFWELPHLLGPGRLEAGSPPV